MIVKELIDTLKKMDPNHKVYILDKCENPIGGGVEIDDIYEISGSTDEANNAVYISA